MFYSFPKKQEKKKREKERTLQCRAHSETISYQKEEHTWDSGVDQSTGL
jgi:hypothetical protein